MKLKSNSKLRNEDYIKYLVWAIVASPVIAVVPYALFVDGPISDEPEDWALFGDYISGALGGLIAYGAFLALICSLKLQRTELRIARKDLRTTQQSLKHQLQELERQRAMSDEQAARLSEQLEQLDRQRVDNYIFKLLELHSTRVANFVYGGHIGPEGLEKSSQAFIRSLVNTMYNKLGARSEHTVFEAIQRSRNRVSTSAMGCFETIRSAVEYITSATMPNTPERSRFFRTLSSQIQTSEAILILALSIEHSKELQEFLAFTELFARIKSDPEIRKKQSTFIDIANSKIFPSQCFGILSEEPRAGSKQALK